MDDSHIIDLLGGTTAVAKLCKVKQPSVSEWRRNGIPEARRQFLQLLRPDVFATEPKSRTKPSHKPATERAASASTR